jgi:hypothetical protein
MPEMTEEEDRQFVEAWTTQEWLRDPYFRRCPTVERTGQDEDGGPTYDFFSERKITQRLIDKRVPDDAEALKKLGAQLCGETLDIVSEQLRGRPTREEEQVEADAKRAEANGLGWDWLAAKLVGEDGPYHLLESIISEASDTSGWSGQVELVASGFIMGIIVCALDGWRDRDHDDDGLVKAPDAGGNVA